MDANELSDLSLLSTLIGAMESDDEGTVYAAWDELESRGWSSKSINEAIKND